MSDDSKEKFRFLRHSSDILIEVTEADISYGGYKVELKDVGLAGL